MKYAHAHHAGNFADVHKHVTLLALLAAMQRKDKGLLAIDTHAGAGLYDLAGAQARRTGEAELGVEKLLQAAARGDALLEAPEIAAYVDAVRRVRGEVRDAHACPGSPRLVLDALRHQDRLVAFERDTDTLLALRSMLRARTAERALPARHVAAEPGDGFVAALALLPPVERRGLILIDPPYEAPQDEWRAALHAIEGMLERFATAVILLWYPLKLERDAERWRRQLGAILTRTEPRREGIAAELWVHPLDSRAGLNGSGLAIVNPPYLFAERMQHWLPDLASAVSVSADGGSRILALG